jgi:release factor glutamine methyltransferase
MPPLTHHLKHDTPSLQHALALDFSSARIEVQCLLQHVLRVSRAYLMTYPERELDAGELAAYRALLARRLQGEPMAYLLGEREFYGLMFNVTTATLIPRPDTEWLVELALARIPQGQPCRVLDMGTGSGAIAVSLAYHRPEAEVTAVDASPDALAVAQVNAEKLLGKHRVTPFVLSRELAERSKDKTSSDHGSTGSPRTDVGKIRFLSSNWFNALAEQRYHVIVSNPPYIRAADPHLQQGDVRHEPLTALASGEDGFSDLRHLITHAPAHLHPNGWLLLEHGYDQAETVRALLQQAGFKAIFSERDLAGIERVSGGQI